MQEPTPPLKLTDELRKASKRVHSVTDALVNARIILVFTDREVYGRAIACFYHIFKAIEEGAPSALKGKKDLQPFLRLMTESPLPRAQAYAEDLAFFQGPEWESKVLPTPETKLYVEHLALLAKTAPTLLLAHAYTQYLAMASGGKLIARMARRQMQLPPAQGTKSFEFGEEGNASELKLKVKAAMDGLGPKLSKEEREQVIAEHLAAFSFNNQIIGRFPIGWWATARGCVRLIPPMTRYALLAAACTAAAAYLLRGRGAQQPARPVR